MLRLIYSFAFVLMFGLPAMAEMSDKKQALVTSLQIEELFEIMRTEGLQYGEDLDADLLAGTGGAKWAAAVSQIYRLDRMSTVFLSRFDLEMPEDAVGPALSFFSSDQGRNIISLEVSARRAQLDETVEDISRDSLRAMISEEDPRLSLLRRFAESNELIETNVVGAMNANYAFYVGLVEGGAFPYEMTEDQILSDVWGQEAEIRTETQEWLYSYLAMAYRPLTDSDLEDYITLSETEAGQTLNRALFAGFDEMFVTISKELGRAAAQIIGGEDI